MGFEIIPDDKVWIVPILVTLFLIEGFILVAKPGLGGFVFFGGTLYFLFFILEDFVSKQKRVNKKLKISPKDRLAYAY